MDSKHSKNNAVNLSIAYISVGSNLGDKTANCGRGLDMLNMRSDTRVTAISKTYRTAPVGFLDQDWFVNLAVKVETRLDPFQLLSVLQDIQMHLGQGVKTVRFGPRLLDLDILLFDLRIIKSQELTLPHPRMHHRRFVLRPLCDIDPGIVHPVFNEKVQVLLDNLNPGEQKIEAMPADNRLLNGTM